MTERLMEWPGAAKRPQESGVAAPGRCGRGGADGPPHRQRRAGVRTLEAKLGKVMVERAPLHKIAVLKPGRPCKGFLITRKPQPV
jgi:hypothetical protein